MNWKTWWPFKIYYQTKSDLAYYRKRHDEIMEVLDERNRQVNQLIEDQKKMWKTRGEMESMIGRRDGEIMRLNEELKKAAETVVECSARLDDIDGFNHAPGVVKVLEEKDINA